MYLIAILLNLFSSYFIASIFKNFLIIFISFFALIVLNMEILSLFSAIGEISLFIFSIVNFLVSFFLFKYKKADFLKINFDFKRLKNSFMLDKSLIILGFCFLVLLLVSTFLAFVTPVIEPDSQNYHFLRAYEFVAQKSLAHFETSDNRALIMPINSEIFYAWNLVFKKSFCGYGVLSLCGFILAICSVWSIFEKFKFAYRKRLYAIFIFSSLASIVIQLPTLQTDLVVGSLLISSIALFFDKKIYFSSLALALAFGVKTTALMAFLSFLILIVLYQIFIKEDRKFDTIKKFLGFLIINFLIFSSYNYILNLIQFHNPISNSAAFQGHCFWGGIKGYIANLIHFAFQSIDFTGLNGAILLHGKLFGLKQAFFDLININPEIGCNVEQKIVGIYVDEQTSGFGVLGFLAFLPMIFVSLVKGFFNKNKKTILLTIFALSFLINILVLARAMAFMVYSIRFVVAFVVLSSVVLIGIYQKKSFYKGLVIFFAVFYMLVVPFHSTRMPFKKICAVLKDANYNMKVFEEIFYRKILTGSCKLAPLIYDTIKEKYPDKKRIAYFKQRASNVLYLKKIEYEGYDIDFINIGNFALDRIKDYDLFIVEGERQNSNVFNPSDVKKKYKILDDSRVVFDSSKDYNCFYAEVRPEDLGDDKKIVGRTCFTYRYFLTLDNLLKLDYIQPFSDDVLEKKRNVYYFIKSN